MPGVGTTAGIACITTVVGNGWHQPWLRKGEVFGAGYGNGGGWRGLHVEVYCREEGRGGGKGGTRRVNNQTGLRKKLSTMGTEPSVPLASAPG